MVKHEMQNIISEILCGKNKDINFSTCFDYHKKNNSPCAYTKQCRIFEKTEEQLRYILSPINQDIFLEACAGSGKTEVVGMKAAYEMNRWNRESKTGIAVLTFTNEAADVIKKRVNEFYNKTSVHPHYIGTLSSFIHGYIAQPYGYKYFDSDCKDSSFRLIDKEERPYKNHWLRKYYCDVKYINKQGVQMDICANQLYYDYQNNDYIINLGNNIEVYFKTYYNSDSFQNYVRGIREKVGKSWLFGFSYCFGLVDKCKKEFIKNGLANFEDMNNIAYKVLLNNTKVLTLISKKFPLIFIDECQDLSWIEIQILNKLKQNGVTLHFIGDINQSIFEFKRANPDFTKKYVHNFGKMNLTSNFRSCQPIVDFSNRLLNIENFIKGQNKNIYHDNSVLYIEYNDPNEAIEKYLNILKFYKISLDKCAIIVKQNKLKNDLLFKINDDNNIHLLISAIQLWTSKIPSNKHKALQYAGQQLAKWIGGTKSKNNYYCPLDIDSAFAWRLFIKSVLNECKMNEKLTNFNVQYSTWYANARNELPVILSNCYQYLKRYDSSIVDREFTKIQYVTPSKTGDLSIQIIDTDTQGKPPINISTIHSSKGCSFDSVMLISSISSNSDGGHWKSHWIEGSGEEKRIGYVASTRPSYLLIWAVPTLNNEERIQIENYGLKNANFLEK